MRVPGRGSLASLPFIRSWIAMAGLGALVLLVALVGLSPIEARAELVYDLSVSGDFTGSGRVSGTTTDGITDFTFTAMTSSSDVSLTYNLGDTTSAEWAIQEPGDELIGLQVLAHALVPDKPLGFFGLGLQLPGTSVFVPDACENSTVTTAVFCGPFGESSEVIFLFGTLTVTPAAPAESVPAPAPLLVVLSGLAALGIAARVR